ncbi:MAG: hypothetical protein WCG34_11335 [Leptolinea sp.]
MGHPTCPKCKALLTFEPAYGLISARVKCILCGWERARPVAVVIPPPERVEVKQVAIRTDKRGTCQLCLREDVYLRGPKCSRCYNRIKRGVDVHAA